MSRLGLHRMHRWINVTMTKRLIFFTSWVNINIGREGCLRLGNSCLICPFNLQWKHARRLPSWDNSHANSSMSIDKEITSRNSTSRSKVMRTLVFMWGRVILDSSTWSTKPKGFRIWGINSQNWAWRFWISTQLGDERVTTFLKFPPKDHGEARNMALPTF